MPPASFYEDFPQIENGVGMVADFLQSAGRTRVPAAITPLRATLVTGVSFSAILKETVARLNEVRGLSLRLLTVRNKFFGDPVTVAGLLTGSDIAAALEGKRLGDLVVIPAEALKEDEGMFLDGMSLGQLRCRFGVKMAPAGRLKDLVAPGENGKGGTARRDFRQNQIYGIFGYPVEHTFSPGMHNAAFKKLEHGCLLCAL